MSRTVVVPCVALHQIAVSYLMHPTFSKLNSLLSCSAMPTAVGSRVTPVYTSRNSGFPSSSIFRGFPSFPLGIDIGFHPHEVPFQSPMHRLRPLRFSSRDIEYSVQYFCCQLRWVSLSRGWAPVCCPVLRGHAHLRWWLTAFQPVRECWLPILFVVGSVVSPICFPFGATSTSPDMHMSHRITVVSAQEHNAFIGLHVHDDVPWMLMQASSVFY